MLSRGQTKSYNLRLKLFKSKRRCPNLRKRRSAPAAWKLRLYNKICFLADIATILGIVGLVCVKKRFALASVSILIAKSTQTAMLECIVEKVSLGLSPTLAQKLEHLLKFVRKTFNVRTSNFAGFPMNNTRKLTRRCVSHSILRLTETVSGGILLTKIIFR